jgi:hypothetical protein
MSVHFPGHHLIKVRAIKDIASGEEFLASYGELFFGGPMSPGPVAHPSSSKSQSSRRTTAAKRRLDIAQGSPSAHDASPSPLSSPLSGRPSDDEAALQSSVDVTGSTDSDEDDPGDR